MEMHELEIWIVVDEGGDYAVGKDQDAACEAFDQEIGGTTPRRQVKVTLKVPAPVAIELTGEVPAEPTGGTLTVK